MKKIKTKGFKMSAIYENSTYSKVYLAWHENKKNWFAINRYDNHIDYFNRLSEI